MSNRENMDTEYEEDVEYRDDAIIGKAFRWSLAAILLLVIAGGTTAYLLTRPEPEPPVRETRLAPVKVREVEEVADSPSHAPLDRGASGVAGQAEEKEAGDHQTGAAVQRADDGAEAEPRRDQHDLRRQPEERASGDDEDEEERARRPQPFGKGAHRLDVELDPQPLAGDPAEKDHGDQHDSGHQQA